MSAGVFDLPDRQATCDVAPGSLLTDAAEAAGVVLNVSCGGAGHCGGCALDLMEGAFIDLNDVPVTVDRRPRRVLGCQTRVADGDFHVSVPKHSLVTGDEKIVVDFEHLRRWKLSPAVVKVFCALPEPTLTDQTGDIERICRFLGEHGYEGHLPASLDALRQAPAACSRGGYAVTVTLGRDGERWRITRVEPGDTTTTLFGLAVDVGTTTVVCSLVDLRTGQITDSASSYNQQVRRCNNVASRISYAAAPDQLEDLRCLIVEETLNRLVGLLAAKHGVDPCDIVRMAVAGNSCMTHLVLGIDPTHLGGVPFQPASNAPPTLTAREVGIAIHPAAPVDVVPATAAYIGGDATADMYACDLTGGDALTLLVDIGTNAEIVVGNRSRVVACAAPAGPAFEGQGLTSGVRASAGAIDSIRISPDDLSCTYSVIDGTTPVGLCGSAMIDFLAQAFKAGLITPAGRFDLDRVAQCGRDCLQEIEWPNGKRVPAYVIAPADRTDDGLRPVLLTEADVATLLQAKGVIFAAMQIAMKHLGRSFDDLDRVILAGGFARHLDLDSAITMGLLPDIPQQRYRFIGNGSLAGAYLHLVDQTVGPAMTRSIGRPEVIELNLDEDFQDAYTCAMFLPNVNADLFPSVTRT